MATKSVKASRSSKKAVPKKLVAKKLVVTRLAAKKKVAARKPAAAKMPVSTIPETEAWKALLPKQQWFVLEYLADKERNAYKAAIKAGYKGRSAYTQASRLLDNPKVKAVIAERTAKDVAKLELSAEWVLAELHKMAAFDVRKLYRPDGSLVPISELDDETAASIAGLEVIEQTSGRGKKRTVVLLKKVKLADKGQNLERLGRHFKLFVDRVEHGADKDFVLTVRSILNGGK